MSRSKELEELWKEIEAKRKKFREENPDLDRQVICPFTNDMKCIGGCPDNRNRACVNGED